MDVGQWKSALARREELPLDLRDAIRMYPEVSSICCKRHCYGILLLFLALKMPTARSVFLRCWKEQGCEATVAVVFETLSAFATAMSMCPMEEETRDIGGPLYAHGWQILLRQLCVVGESGNGKVLYLGNGQASVRLQNMSCEAERSIGAWLNTHPSVFAVIQLKAPGMVRDWNKMKVSRKPLQKDSHALFSSRMWFRLKP